MRTKQSINFNMQHVHNIYLVYMQTSVSNLFSLPCCHCQTVMLCLALNFLQSTSFFYESQNYLNQSHCLCSIGLWWLSCTFCLMFHTFSISSSHFSLNQVIILLHQIQWISIKSALSGTTGTGGCKCGVEKTSRIVRGTEVTPVSVGSILMSACYHDSLFRRTSTPGWCTWGPATTSAAARWWPPSTWSRPPTASSSTRRAPSPWPRQTYRSPCLNSSAVNDPSVSTMEKAPNRAPRPRRLISIVF